MKGFMVVMLAVAAAFGAWWYIDTTQGPKRKPVGGTQQKQPSAAFVVAKDGVIKADIVIPAKPLDAERYAADELKHHLDKAFSASMKIVSEGSFNPSNFPCHFYIGATAAAKRAGIPGRELKKDEHVVKTVGNGLFLLGRDSDIKYKDIGNIWNPTIYATIYAVYDFLETEMGVKWIWPGPTGEVIPKRRTLELGALDRRSVEPLEERYLHGTAPWGMPKVGFSSEEAAARFYAGQNQFLVRHRVGRRRRTKSGHSFESWWKRFGTSHPEYFNMLPGGVRRPASAGGLVTMCVSEPGVWKQKVEDWKEWWKKDGARYGFAPWVNCCENDFVALCQCPKCRAWDAPDERFAKAPYWNGTWTIADIDRIRKEKGVYGLNSMMNDNRWGIPKDDSSLRPIPSLADRYAKFYNAVQAEVRKVDPKAQVAGYAYENYLEPPKETKVDPSVVIIYVPRSYFPYDKTESDYFRKGWMGWRKAGVKEFMYRPNIMLAGGNYPFDQGRLLLADFAFAYTNGMNACEFDSLRGSWACHALLDYALIRAFRDPLHGYDRAREEMLSAFGPAREEVAKYLDAVRRHTEKWSFAAIRRIAWQNSTGGNHGGGSYHNSPAILGDYFDEKFFTEGYALLDAAKRRASADAEVAMRVEFLRKGLRDAELTRRTRIAEKAMNEAPDDAARKAAFEAAFKKMNEYRASVEGDFVCNFRYEGRTEMRMKWPHKELTAAPKRQGKGIEY